MISQAELYITTRRRKFASDLGLEDVACLHFESRIDAPNIAVGDILRGGNQNGRLGRGTILVFPIQTSQPIPAGIAIGAGGG